MCGSEALCIVESPSRTAGGGGGGLAEQRHARAQHASATACMESSWQRTKYDPITWRRLLVCWAPELGVKSASHQPPKPKAGPGQTGIMASGKRGLFHSLLSLPHFLDGGLRHNLTGTPFSRWPYSSIV
ncbi:hypothetical protein H0G86_003096 [Trichoderma simmonsii]|uniref:Uncharacterized protein n=1 Tax=Trichoderma simmonsii TaxID=1491479 RepID=A0A8G0PGM0_9HYPO|nr:hypothetical protein H0G86_003096 [Trichoderma simmonsii]